MKQKNTQKQSNVLNRWTVEDRYLYLHSNGGNRTRPTAIENQLTRDGVAFQIFDAF